MKKRHMSMRRRHSPSRIVANMSGAVNSCSSRVVVVVAGGECSDHLLLIVGVVGQVVAVGGSSGVGMVVLEVVISTNTVLGMCSVGRSMVIGRLPSSFRG